MKLSLIATLIGLAFAAGTAQATTCAIPDSQPTVSIGHLPTSVPNLDTDGSGSGNCTLNDLILEEGNYADQAAWLAHVESILAAVPAGSLSAAQKDEIRAKTAAYDIKRYQRIKIIGFNDFHGTLRSPGNLFSTPVGGIDYFAGYVDAIRAKNPTGTVIISAGDLIGASPLVSALFHDEGTVEAMNRLGAGYGLDFDAVGNHEFDEGKGELKRMQEGGCHPTDHDHTCMGDVVGTPNPFEGAKFNFLAANVIDVAGQKTLFPSYQIKIINGTRVAFIGLVLKGTPTIVTPSGVEGLEFQDEADATNALIRQIRNKGAEVIVVSIHQGGGQVASPSSVAGYNACTGFTGDIVDVVKRLDPAIDLVISGHTHNVYNCQLPTRNGKLVPVTSALAFGRVVTEVDITVDRKSRDAVAVTPWNTIVFRNNPAITPNAALNNLVAGYETIATPLANRVIGSIQGELSNSADAVGRQPAGFVIADSQLAATSPAGFGDAVVAFMNPGGVRSPGFTYRASAANEGDGNVTYGEAFTVQPFGNSLVTMSLTGQQLKNVLEQQFRGCGTQNANRIMQPSTSLSYAFTPPATWTTASTTNLNTACNWVDASSIRINGVVVDPAASYRITVNNFMATGGDNYTEFKLGTGLLGGAVDIDALSAYFQAYGSPLPVPDFVAQPRVTRR